MPFSDWFPPIVVPASEEGRLYARDRIWREEPTIHVAFCDEYEPCRHPVYEDGDFMLPRGIRVCARRDRSGVRDRQWCYRCMAGYPYAPLYKEDERQLSNTAIRV